MILVLGGTREGREAARALHDQGYAVLLTTLTDYGAQLGRQEQVETQAGALDEDGLRQMITSRGIRALVDATHPFAKLVKEVARHVSVDLGVPYLRLERERTRYQPEPGLIMVENFAEAAQTAARLPGNIFLTIGSRHLPVFLEEPQLRERRIIARILPDRASLQRCLDLGLQPANIVAMQGPFDRRLNAAMYSFLEVGVVVTKDSGPVGGVEDKIAAARIRKISVIMVNRPEEAPSFRYRSVAELIKGLQEEGF